MSFDINLKVEEAQVIEKMKFFKKTQSCYDTATSLWINKLTPEEKEAAIKWNKIIDERKKKLPSTALTPGSRSRSQLNSKAMRGETMSEGDYKYLEKTNKRRPEDENL